MDGHELICAGFQAGGEADIAHSKDISGSLGYSYNCAPLQLPMHLSFPKGISRHLPVLVDVRCLDSDVFMCRTVANKGR